MERIRVFGDKSFDIKELSLEDLDMLNDSVDAIMTNYVISLKKDENTMIDFYYNDQDHPITYIKDAILLSNALTIDMDYYKQNEESLDERIKLICANVTSSSFMLGKEFIKEDILKVLAKNSNIERLILAEDAENYALTKEVYDILKDSSIEAIVTADVVPELKDVYGAKIAVNDNRRLISYLTYNDIIQRESFYFSEPLTDEELYYLKYVKDDCLIEIERVEDFDQIFKIVNRLEECGKHATVVLSLRKTKDYYYKNNFNKYIAEHPELYDKNIRVEVGFKEDYSLKDYIEYEKRLYDLIKDAQHLSPFEKFLYAYNIVKKFKEYKENEADRTASRDLYALLDNEYMVCVGYAAMLEDLLDKLGIENAPYSVTLDVGFDKVPNDAIVIPDDVELSYGGHARVKVHLVDPKYGIDGYYFSDPTWDNVMSNDTYNYALMTQSEYVSIHRTDFMYFSNVNELFFASTIEEFSEKVNIWIDRNYSKKRKEYDISLISSGTRCREYFSKYMEKLKEFDEEEYNNVNTLFRNLYSSTKPANNIKEFIEREKKFLDKKPNDELHNIVISLQYEDNAISKNWEDFKIIDKMIQKDLIKEMIDSLQLLDNKKYNYLHEKYKEAYDDSFIPDEYFLSSAIYELGELVVGKMNSYIDGSKFREAITELYRINNGLEGEELERTVDQVMQYNAERQLKCFPTRYRIDDSGKMPINDDENKFDVEEPQLAA